MDEKLEQAQELLSQAQQVVSELERFFVVVFDEMLREIVENEEFDFEKAEDVRSIADVCGEEEIFRGQVEEPPAEF